MASPVVTSTRFFMRYKPSIFGYSAYSWLILFGAIRLR